MRLNNLNSQYALNAYSNLSHSKISKFEKINKQIKSDTIKNNKEGFKNKDVSLVSKTDTEDIQIAQEIKQLKSYENSVIEHERAHMLSGGNLAGSASYTYTTGPDGKRYINGGNVSMRLPPTNSFETMLKNIKRVKSAASAPHNPSPQDMQTAAMASAQEASIKTEALLKKTADMSEKKVKQNHDLEKSESNGLDPIEKMIKKTYTTALSKMTFETRASFEMMV